MGIIHVLPETVANKIAAGEVIERPASIVKELVENSLDAGATSIDISIRSGGKSLIRVSDDGCGMVDEDAELAFQRHATSKITSADDLDRILSFGFRGEALPSIAAVSRMKLVTRTKGKSAGTEVVIEGGKTLSVKPSPCRDGTIAEVRDLFFNTPARRKFLKTDSTELGHILDVVSNLAFANLGIHFSLKSSEKTLLELPPAQTLLERAAVIWGDESSHELIEIDGDGTDIRVWGIIGKPRMARANRSGQIFFVNRRWVKAASLSYALMDGYHGLLMGGQYPMAVIFIDVNPERVDVNVHPTKQEVRISKESEIKSLVYRTVMERLQQETDLAPVSRIPQDFTLPRPPDSRETSYLDFKSGIPVAPDALKMAEPSAMKLAEEESGLTQPIVFRDQLRITKVLGQIHHTFIVAETEEGMIIIDQHAAHERVMFEALLRDIQSGSPKRQGLLMDEILELHPKQQEIVKAAWPMLTQLGFEIEKFGENSLVIRSYPAALEDDDPIACLKMFLEEKEEGKLRTTIDNLQEEAAALIACKRQSVKAHDPLTPAGMRALLERLAHTENPFNCPHGRPTFFKYSFFDLEKQFKRK
ncbi:MAG: DNA mismatch repair endonuclease MutL [Candidatus Omnitrophica bacterium]|nr:DNA mismatch repair endonuclease MutL [Candidatus Omnitrophota bacterium]